MLLGSLIRCYRQMEKISVRQLAKLIGVNYSALSRFERGANVTSKQSVKIIAWVLTTENAASPKQNI